MTINDILECRSSIIKLTKIKFNNFKTTIDVYKLYKQIEETLSITDQENKKIIDIYCKKDQNGKVITKEGKYQFDSNDNMNKYLNDINKLVSQEVSFGKVSINVNDIDINSSEKLSTSDMVLLESLIEWIY